MPSPKGGCSKQQLEGPGFRADVQIACASWGPLPCLLPSSHPQDPGPHGAGHLGVGRAVCRRGQSMQAVPLRPTCGAVVTCTWGVVQSTDTLPAAGCTPGTLPIASSVTHHQSTWLQCHPSPHVCVCRSPWILFLTSPSGNSYPPQNTLPVPGVPAPPAPPASLKPCSSEAGHGAIYDHRPRSQRVSAQVTPSCPQNSASTPLPEGPGCQSAEGQTHGLQVLTCNPAALREGPAQSGPGDRGLAGEGSVGGLPPNSSSPGGGGQGLASKGTLSTAMPERRP